MKKKNVNKLSYESDGKMGFDKEKKSKENDGRKEKMFFNITQNSE
ncbi:hypothetical protein ACNRWW_12155 [Metabacillus sp. HB246100]|nr:hypothetical protein [Bacillus weihaiensis]